MPNQSYWVNLLDMGGYKYGDSIFLNHPEVRILIDGGYGGLAEDRPDVLSLPNQLRSFLHEDPPFDIDLLVVTHCHLDHIGCLPRLVANGAIQPQWALVADPKLGFPKVPDSDSRAIGPGLMDLVLAAVRDEPHSDLSDEELLAYLEDTLTLESRYRTMIEDLRGMGARVFRYGRDSLTDFKQHFSPLGLTTLGPTYAHLQHCSDYLLELQSDALIRARDALGDVGPADGQRRVDVFRRVLTTLLADSGAIEEDRPGRGSALNDQSIVLLFESGGGKALLTGDMQLAAAEVPGLDDMMERLVGTLEDEAPFDFHKLAHHSSYNGLNRDIFERLPARVFGHTGGQNSASHPHGSVLRLLEEHANDHEWVRTDRNGRVGVRLGDGPIRLFLSRGHQNDYRPPLPVDGPPAARKPPVGPEPPVERPRQPEVQKTVSRDTVEVTARIPHTGTRVTVTIDVDPTAQTLTDRSPAEPSGTSLKPAGAQLASGREIPRLLFVTSPRLGQAIGSEQEAGEMLELLRRADHEVFENIPWEPGSAPQAVRLVQQKLRELGGPPAVHGVVLLGNYDVVPALALDVLDEDLRGAVTFPDHDRFVVWSDDLYGDLDGDKIPELAVSRILHETGSTDLVWKSLTNSGPHGDARFGIRNVHRPFAEVIYQLVPGVGPLLVSEPTTHSALGTRPDPSSADYFMLHGGATDATVFWGESDHDEDPEAFQVDNVPDDYRGVVFAGCCWGALPVTEPAGWRAPDQPVIPRTRVDSIPIRYLAAGASAFVGCTGTHYSPGEPPYNYFGAPFHQAFWTHVQAGYPPALALFEAKKHYAASIPHITGSPAYTAVELKILQQFTCLGMGW